MQTVIGVDPSSRAMHAVVTHEDEPPLAVYLPLHKTDKTLACAETYKWMRKVVDENVGLGDAFVFIEIPVMGRAGAHTMLVIAQVIGAAAAAAVHSGAKVVFVNNMTWKSKVIGGRVGKPEIKQWVRKNASVFYEQVDGQQDLCDAYCINQYGQKVLGIATKKYPLGKRKVIRRKKV